MKAANRLNPDTRGSAPRAPLPSWERGWGEGARIRLDALAVAGVVQQTAACCLHRAEAGMCARRRTYFLWFAKESRQRKRPLPCGFCFAKIPCASHTGRETSETRCAALRSDSRGLFFRPALRCSAAKRGWDTPGKKSQRLRLPYQDSLPVTSHQSWCAGLPTPSAGLSTTGLGGKRTFGCLSGAPAQRVSEGSRRVRGAQGIPRSGTRQQGSFSLVPFFVDTKKGTAPPGAHPGLSPVQATNANDWQPRERRVTPSANPPYGGTRKHWIRP
ncbi:hypothetical protein EV687_1131 [Corticibacter populi]|nr:hypothetical protein EV687_1131 [Corticibacter populi]